MVSNHRSGDDSPEDSASGTLETMIDMDHPDLQEILAEAVGHPSQSLRIQAALRLAELFQDARAMPGLAEALDAADRRTQKAAAEAIWEIGDADVSGLLRLLTHAHNPVRDRVADALDRIGWQPDDPHDEAAYYVAAHRWRACVWLGTDSVRPLLKALRDPDGNVRRGAAWALGVIGDERAVPGLIRLLDDREGGLLGIGERVCDIAAEALQRIGTPQARDALDKSGLT